MCINVDLWTLTDPSLPLLDILAFSAYFNSDINFSNLHIPLEYLRIRTYLSKLQLNSGSGRLTSQLDWFFSSFIGVFHGVSPVSHHFPEAENNDDDDKGRRWRTWCGYGTSGPGMQGRGGHHHHRVRRGLNRFQGPCSSRKGQPRPPKE